MPRCLESNESSFGINGNARRRRALSPEIWEKLMATKPEDREFHKRMQQIENLINEVEGFPDPRLKAQTKEIIQAILDLHEAGLSKIFEHLADAGETGQAAIDSLAGDDLVGSLMLLYGLHPLDLETRVGQALEKARPGLRAHGGNVVLLSVNDGVVRLRMEGSCNGCPSSAVTLKTTIEETIYERAPDVTAIEVEAAVSLEARRSA